MVKAAAARGWLDERTVAIESLTAMHRTGAGLHSDVLGPQSPRWLAQSKEVARVARGQRAASCAVQLIAASTTDRICIFSASTRRERSSEMMRARSQAAFEGLKRLIPGGVNSPARASAASAASRSSSSARRGAYLFDIDGNRYLDYIGSWGPMILGHAPPGGGRGHRRRRCAAAPASARRPWPKANWPS